MSETLSSLVPILVGTVIAIVVVLFLAKGVRRVPPGMLGVVDRRFGSVNPADSQFDQIRVHGSPGFQADTLKADRRYMRLPLLYRVSYVPRIEIPAGTIGIVVAKDGAQPPLTRTLGRYVYCNNFQEGAVFLLNGGQKGRQPSFLPGDASYAINPKLFDVFTVDTIGAGRKDLSAADLKEIRIPEGTTGVVIVYEGEVPDEEDGAVGRRVPGHESFQLPSVFLDNGGQRGVQEETLDRGGVYRINPWFASVELVPTRVLVLEWTKRDKKPSSNFDATLDQIRVSIDGDWLKFDMSQTIRIPAKAAPRLVSRFGQQDRGNPGTENTAAVRRFVDRVLGPLVEGYFHAAAGETNILEFMSNYNEVRLGLETQVREALKDWGIEAVRTTLSEFEPENTELDKFRIQLARKRDRNHELEHEKESAITQSEIEAIQLDTEKRRLQLKLQGEIDLLGRDNVAMRSFLAELAKMKVPEVVAGSAESLLGHMPLPVVQNLIARAFGRDSNNPPRLATASDADREGRVDSETLDNPAEYDNPEEG